MSFVIDVLSMPWHIARVIYYSRQVDKYSKLIPAHNPPLDAETLLKKVSQPSAAKPSA